MISFQPGEVLLVAFPFTSGPQTKVRPALVVVDSGDSDIVLARITTQFHQSAYDVSLADWRGAGLIAPSTVRLHKLVTVSKTRVFQRLGRLVPADLQAVSSAMGRTYGAW